MKGLYFWLCMGLISGCGSMHITTNQPDARIFLDETYVGTGDANVTRIGPPGTGIIRVEYSGHTVEQKVSRSFTLGTLGLAAISAYTGLFWGWFYPDRVEVLLPSGFEGEADNPWLPKVNKTKPNPWLKVNPSVPPLSANM